jgi:hypothetical protein
VDPTPGDVVLGFLVKVGSRDHRSVIVLDWIVCEMLLEMHRASLTFLLFFLLEPIMYLEEPERYESTCDLTHTRCLSLVVIKMRLYLHPSHTSCFVSYDKEERRLRQQLVQLQPQLSLRPSSRTYI